MVTDKSTKPTVAQLSQTIPPREKEEEPEEPTKKPIGYLAGAIILYANQKLMVLGCHIQHELRHSGGDSRTDAMARRVHNNDSAL